MTHLHAALYRRTGGRFLTRIGGQPVLLLTTTGRRSGLERTTPVQYLRHGDDLLVVAAAQGAPTPPAWALNLDAQPAARVQVGRTGWVVEAHRAAGTEREALWDQLCEANRWLPRVQQKAGRELGVYVLSPAQQERPPGPVG